MQNKELLYVNIGGTSRSGSTLLGKILSNDPKAIYVGEIQAIFSPTRTHHIETIQNINKSSGPWKIVLEKKSASLPSSIFEAYNEKEFVVDSSKNSFWISRLKSNSDKQYINHKNILIYKDPKDFAYSILKRGKKNWAKQYISYHKKYFANIDNFYVVSFTSLIEKKQTLRSLCGWLEIEYFESKYDYWNNPHMGFFGSNTPNTKKSVEYTNYIPSEYLEAIKKTLHKYPEINTIWNYLKQNENKVVTNCHLKYNKFHLNALKIKNKIKIYYRKFNPENYIDKL